MRMAAIRALLIIATAVAGAVAVAPVALADNCAARCRAKEMKCLQQSKGDTARCNRITTKCYQRCRKPR